MTNEQLRASRRASMDRGDHFGVSLCNRALDAVSAPERDRLAAAVIAREDLRERVLRGEA